MDSPSLQNSIFEDEHRVIIESIPSPPSYEQDLYSERRGCSIVDAFITKSLIQFLSAQMHFIQHLTSSITEDDLKTDHLVIVD